MDRQNFLGEGHNYEGRFPISANTFDFMQNQIEFVSQLASAFGDNVLLKRATATKPGLIVLNGELLPLTAGTSTGNYYHIVEHKDGIEAQGTLYADARVTRYAERTSSSASAIEVSSVVDLTGRANKGETIANQFLPKGAIIMWSGSWDSESIPKGFVLCNGNNGQPVNGVTIPDLRGKFIVGGNGSDSDFNTPGSVDSQGNPRGSKTHTLTVNEMPSHSHAISDDSEYFAIADNHGTEGVGEGGSGARAWNTENSTQKHIYNTQPKGGGQPFKHLPPYYVLAFLIKVI
ncbi:MAG: hypothetical protein IKI25_07845 [Bacteroidales bacterium]|nr:hypothetical protein [Bacteroidales bacterium]